MGEYLERILYTPTRKIDCISVPNIDTMNSPSPLQPISKETRFVLQQLDTHEDILHTILGFCFYDRTQAERINSTKRHKQEICIRIRSALSRNTCVFANHWAFGFPNRFENGEFELFEETLQLQASNCDICGQYQQFHAHDPALYSDTILCTCI
jgi:hypothetical protein